MSAPVTEATGQVEALQPSVEQPDAWRESVRNLLTVAGAEVVNIVGVGNPIKGDDAIGLEVVRSLRREVGRSRLGNIRIHPPTLNPEHVITKIARKKERLVVIDAVEANVEPGTIVCSKLGNTKFGFFATHNIPLRLLPDVSANLDDSYLIGVQVGSVEVDETITERVRASGGLLVAEIKSIAGDAK